MLIVTREPGESLTITLEDGRKIKVLIVGVGTCQKVRIGIDAARTINVLRDEVANARKA